MTVVGNWAQETTTTAGTGILSLAGPVTDRRSLISAAIAETGDPTGPWVVAAHIYDGTDFEAGLYTLTAGTPDTLARTTVLRSTNGNAAVNWGAGTRNVVMAPLAQHLNLLFGATAEATAAALALRDGDGNLKVGTPTDNDHAVPKSYADDLISDATPNPTADALARRDAAGRLQVASGVNPADVARLDDVSAVQGDLDAHIGDGGTDAHTLVTPDPGGTAGFMSPADKAKLDGLPAAPFRATGIAYTPGTAVMEAAHGLGGVPDFAAIWLVCATAEGDYSVGDRILLGSLDSSSNDDSVTIYANATKVGVTVRYTNHQAVRYGGTTAFVPSPANWSVAITALRWLA